MTRKHTRVERAPAASASKTDILREPAELRSRRIGLALLADVRAARDRLDDPNDESALHDFRVALRRLRSLLRAFGPQLRDTMDAKIERRLERIADATGASRDLEVHVEWAKRARRSMRDRGRPGADWLIRHLRADKRKADADLRDNLDRHFSKAVRQTERALERYEARVADDGPRFGEVAADLVSREASALESAIERVTSQGDRAEVHAARIAAKRLRYAVEPLAGAGAPTESLVADLKRMQNTLGELHDAQVFGSELATMISKLIAQRGEGRPKRTGARSSQSRAADPVPGLRTMLRRLRRAEAKSFQKFQRRWRTDDWRDACAAQLAAIDRSLR